MAELSANAAQDLAPNAALAFTEIPVPDTSGLIFTRVGSGVIRLASPAKIIGKLYGGCPCNRRLLEAVYDVAFHANIGVPTGGTVGEISIAIAIDGAVDPSSTMIINSTGAGTLDHVGAAIQVVVPSICGCETISIVNTSAENITVQNANLIVRYAGLKL